MNRHLTIIGALLRKDLLSLWPFTILVVTLQVLQVLDREFGLEFISAQAKQFLPIIDVLAYCFFVLVVVHQDAMSSLRHDGLTRPIPGHDRIAAKGIFIWSVIFLPVVLGTFIASLIDDRSVVESILLATTVENLMLVTLVLLVAVIAAVTSSLLEAAGALVGLLITLLLVERWVTRLASTGEAVYFLGSGWVILKPLIFLALVSVAVVIWLQYVRRNTTRARVTLGVLAVLLMAFPAPFTWNRVFVIQKAVAKDPAAADSLNISLTPDCFPSTIVNPPFSSMNEMLAENANASKTTAPHMAKINPAIFDEDRRQAAGQSAIAFATAMVPSGAPLDWKVMISNVKATYRNDRNEILHSPWHARITPIWKPTADGALSAVHFWLLPREVYQRLASQPSHLQLDYSLSLLEPHSFEIPVDGERQRLPAVGYCGAIRDHVTGDVTVECFKHGAQPALVAAEFVGAPTTKVFIGDPDYTPKWLGFFGGMRRKATLHRSEESNASRIKITAYEARAHTERQLVVPGVLGGPTNTCAAPQIN